MASVLHSQMDYLLFICGVCYIGISVMCFYYGCQLKRINRWAWLGVFGALQAFAWWSLILTFVLPNPRPVQCAASIAMALSCFPLAGFAVNTLVPYLSNPPLKILPRTRLKVIVGFPAWGAAAIWAIALLNRPWDRVLFERSSFLRICIYFVFGFSICLLGIWKRSLVEGDINRFSRQRSQDLDSARYANRVTWISVAVLVIGWFAAQCAGRIGEEAARSQFLERSVTASAALDHRNIGNLEYSSIAESLRNIPRVNPNNRYAYLIRRTPDGKVYLIAESEPRGLREYQPVTKELERIFDGRCKAAVAGSVTGHHDDLISSYAVVSPPDKAREAVVLGIDISPDEMLRIVEYHRLAAIFFVALVIVCIVVIAITIRVWIERIADADFINKRYDSLTGLANRTLLAEYLADAVKTASMNRKKVAVVLFDLDQFKRVNDTLGHEAGDRLLRYVAGMLEGWAGENDLVARLGGDEFAAVLVRRRTSGVIGMIGKLIESFNKTIDIDGNSVHITPSIGVSVYPTDGSGDDLVKNAETAMYQAKEQGRNRYRFYTAEMNARAQERFALENRLMSAIENDEFVLHYQPQLDLRTGAITAMEALVRWQHPELGLLSPNSFIPMAEEIGLIEKIGEIVLKKACSQVREWLDEGFDGFRIAVNLSGAQFKPDLPQSIQRVLGEVGVDPHILEVEITETSAIKNLEFSSGIMDKLRALGISIALDDFGTGYSSLIYLRRLPLETVKIDRNFISDIAINPETATIVSAIITMAHSLNMKVLAEGVESDEQLNLLKDCGCDAAQGYAISRPLPADSYRREFLVPYLEVSKDYA